MKRRSFLTGLGLSPLACVVLAKGEAPAAATTPIDVASGVPISRAHKPDKDEIRAWGAMMRDHQLRRA